MARTFTLRVEDTEYEVETQGRALRINGKLFRPEIDGEMITVEGATHRIEIDGQNAFVDGIVYPFETEGLEERKNRGLGSVQVGPQAAGGGAVTAIMPGLIIKVVVEEGSSVSAGDVIVILEAMKMESEICSPIDGVVKEVSVKAGDNVTQNQVLAIVEEA